VSFKVHRVTPEQQSEPGNLEGRGRRLRYDWLANVAEACGIPCVATGHTADDQAETVLFRLLRGTGLDGLRGIAACRTLTSQVSVIRPLLSLTRQGVLDYLAHLGQDYRTDQSNADSRFTRNRIRHELLPLLARDYNPRVREALGRFAEQARECRVALGDAAIDLIERAEKAPAGRIVGLDEEMLSQAPVGTLRRAWRLIWECRGWPMGEMGYREWTRLADFCQGDRRGLQLPGGIRVRRKGRVIQAGPANGGT